MATAIEGYDLIGIDIQNSFMDWVRPKNMNLVPFYNCDRDRMILPDGTEFLSALPVPGALDDTSRTVKLIRKLGKKIKSIILTFDTHWRHIAHPSFWVGRNGKPPKGMSVYITAEMVRSGEWLPVDAERRVPSLGSRKVIEIVLAYLDLTGGVQIWNEHCMAQTWGHNMHPELAQAVAEWEDETGNRHEPVHKGFFEYAEHFGGFKAMGAELYPTVNSTQANTRVLEKFKNRKRKKLLVGQARTHCVKSTAEQVFEFVPPEMLKDFIVVDDCMSNIPALGAGHLDFPARADEFFAAYAKKGLVITDSRAIN
ncbi:MAG: hypothetical protein WAX89_03730 [Alphaproteobacteria bacterium]